MKTMMIPVIIIAALSFTTMDKLTGRWESLPSPTGAVTSVLFKQDNSFEAYVNRKPFATGSYDLKDSLFSFVDNGCNGVRGSYKIIFFSNSDSLRFEPIDDSCTGRKNGMSKLVFGRVHKKTE